MKRVILTMAMAAMMGVTGSAASRADTTSDRMRCDALKLRCDSQNLNCQASCLQRAAGYDTQRRSTLMDGCDQRCKDRHQRNMERMQEKAVCGGHEPPNPMKCAARLKDAEAKWLNCMVRCDDRASNNRDFDETKCNDTCQSNYDSSRTEILALDICSKGPGIYP